MDQSYYDLKYDLKDCFTMLKKTGSTKKYMLASKYDVDFEKAADICKELDASAIDYINAQFTDIHPDRVFPTMLHSKYARTKYKTFMESRKFDFEEEFKVSQIYVQTAARTRPVEEILLDDVLHLPPWFRICISLEAFPSVIAKYKSAAQAMFNDRLKKFLISKGLDYKRIIL